MAAAPGDAAACLALVGFDGVHPDDPGVQALRRQAEAGQVVGAIFMGYNIVAPPQVRRLTAAMRSWRTPAPFIVAVDQEGGQVSRLVAQKGFETFPAALDVARSGEAGIYDRMAEQLRDLGFNLNFGPVVDLARNHDSPAIGARRRAYAADVDEVTR